MIFALTLVPFLYLIFFTAHYYINFPYWDQWDLIPLIEKSFNKTLTLKDLFLGNPEQRIFFTKLLTVGLAQWTYWNHKFEIALNVILSVTTFILILFLVWRIRGLSLNKFWQSDWLIPALSLIFFSLNQWEYFSWGFGVYLFLNAFAVVIGIMLLSSAKFSWIKFFLVILMGVIATNSSVVGLNYWLIGLVLLFVYNTASKRTFYFRAALWLLIILIDASSYIYNYLKFYNSSHDFSLKINSAVDLLKYLKYLLIYLGAGLISFNTTGAIIAGVFGLLLLIYAFIRLDKKVITPFLALSVYSIMAALITAFGRGSFYANQALSSRYIIISHFFWISNILFMYLLLKSVEFNMLKRHVLITLITVTIILTLGGSIYGGATLISRFNYLKPARIELQGMTNDELLKRLHHNPAIIKENIKILKKYHLSIYK